ncbi:MAG: Tim44 domain-containing protein [Betaproteobacteria bacterium]|nr:Tim44 domain-containing protein [Betaproteobacteria bacterium]
MSKFVFAVAAAFIGAVFVVTEVEAKRLGGARNVGAQRSITNPPPAKPAQQAAPTQQAAPAAAAGAAQPATGFARWMPLLGGLALGGALGWLMGANGLGGLMVGILLVALLAFGALLLVRMLAARRRQSPQPMRMQYAAGMGQETVAAPPPSQSAGFEVAPAAAAANVPAGFDLAGFLRGAKLNFMKLQAANDSGDLDELREFTAPELFEELRRDIESRGGNRQQTDILALNADLLEVTTEGGRHWASVRFAGTLRETPASAPVGFEEVWNLAKPADGSSGWLLSGIQQMH